MNTELSILKQISENEGMASPHTVAKHLKFGNGYVEYLCEQLLKKGLIKKLKGKSWYKITRKGRKEIGEKIEPSKTITKRKKITKKAKKKKYKREPKPEKKRIKKQTNKKRKKTRKSKTKRKKEQPKSLTSTKPKAKQKKKKKGIKEVFKKLFTKTSKKAK